MTDACFKTNSEIGTIQTNSGAILQEGGMYGLLRYGFLTQLERKLNPAKSNFIKDIHVNLTVRTLFRCWQYTTENLA